MTTSLAATAEPLTRNQIRGFWASWGGWTLDGMDSFIYALVLVPSLRELLPRSGLAATKGNIGFYGGLLFGLVSSRVGARFFVGTRGRQIRAGTHADADDRVVFVVYVLERVRHQRLAACDPSLAGGHRNWRRMGHGRHVCRRRMAGAPAAGWRGLHAYRILRGSFSCGAGQLCDREPLRLARDVRGGRAASAAACVDSPRSNGASVLDAKKRRSTLLGNLAAVCDAVFERVAAANDLEFGVHAGVDLRAVGRDGVRSRGRHRAGGG